jgi:hypothetical protein
MRYLFGLALISAMFPPYGILVSITLAVIATAFLLKETDKCPD